MMQESEKLLSTLRAACKSPKAMSSLENIEKAVDLILEGKGRRTLASVAKICEGHFGGPKYQSICNNRNYRAYIKARFSEARIDTIALRHDTLPSVEAEALIGALRADIEVLTKENARLRKAFRSLQPIPLSKLLNEPSCVDDHASDAHTDVDVVYVSKDGKRDIKAFLDQSYDLGFDLSSDGRLVSSEGLSVIGVDGMKVIHDILNSKRHYHDER